MEITEKTQERLLSRKFLGQLAVAVILVIVFVLILSTGNFTEPVFRMWLVALLADFGIYGVANVAGKFAPQEKK